MNSDYQCIECAEGCLACSSLLSCEICDSGSFRTKSLDGSVSCSSFCPEGTKPSISSMYYLNKDLFT